MDEYTVSAQIYSKSSANQKYLRMIKYKQVTENSVVRVQLMMPLDHVDKKLPAATIYKKYHDTLHKLLTDTENGSIQTNT